MAYSDLTFNDKNPVKRWLQSRRLVTAQRIVECTFSPKTILDFGAGNGELCKLISHQFPGAHIVCYEPTPALMAEAKENLKLLPNVRFCTDISEIPDGTIELIFCLEVFEHLPEKETKDALDQFERVLSTDGAMVIGVPVEIGIPALYKGIFRMSRRFGAFDASIKNVSRAILGFPPRDRPVLEIAPGFPFHNEHMGFDYRHLRKLLRAKFSLEKMATSPFPFFGPLLNAEANFLLRKIS